MVDTEQAKQYLQNALQDSSQTMEVAMLAAMMYQIALLERLVELAENEDSPDRINAIVNMVKRRL